MNWNYILYKKEELCDGRELQERVAELWMALQEKNIRIVVVCENENFLDTMTALSIPMEEVVILVTRDVSVEEVKGFPVAVVAVKEERFPKESLFGADALVEDLKAVEVEYLEKIYQRKHKIPWQIAQTRRCLIREMTIEDVPALCKLYEGKKMTEYLEPLASVEEEIEKAQSYIQNMYSFYGYGMWLVFHRKSNRLVGRVGFHLSEYKGETILELGYAIGTKNWGCGLATEVCEAVISYAITEELGFDSLYCFIHKENVASLRVAEKLGFFLVGQEFSAGQNIYVFSKKLFTNEKK